MIIFKLNTMSKINLQLAALYIIIMALPSLFSCPVASNSCYAMDCSPPVFLCLWEIPYILSYMWNLRYRYESESVSHSVRSNSLWPHGLYSPWNSPGQNTRVGSLSLLQEMVPTQGLKPGVPHCRQTLYQLSHQGSPRTLEWIASPFSTGSS